MYKILCSAMGYDGGKSGISSYINNVVGELIKDHRVDLIILNKDIKYFPLKEHKNLRFITFPDYLSKPIVSMLWHLFILPFSLNFKNYDFCLLPAGNRRLFCLNKIPTLVTFHDLSQFYIDAKYSYLRIFYIKKIIPYFLKKADKVLAVSKNTKNDIEKFYRFPSDKIIVNYNGYSKTRPKKTNQQSILELFKIKKKYILYVARIEHPGKNHINLIKAYESLTSSYKKEFDLVLVGNNWNGSQEVHQYAESSRDSENIRFLGFVKGDELNQLYKKASLYVFPSLYEGFGIPLLEAMAAGVPVICSNSSSLPEIGKDAVQLFDPYSPESIKLTITKVLTSDSVCKTMTDKGLERVKEFSWGKHSKTIINVYEKITEKNNIQ